MRKSKQIDEVISLAFSLVPNRVCRSVHDIDAQSLARKGVKLVIADLDNTLAAYSDARPSREVCNWRDGLHGAGVALFVLSNSRKPSRAADYCAELGVPFIAHAGKPNPRAFHRAMAQMGATPAQTVVIGDQIFTDILGARRAGVRAVLVEPIRLAGNPGRYVRYAAEYPVRLWARTRKTRKEGCA